MIVYKCVIRAHQIWTHAKQTDKLWPSDIILCHLMRDYLTTGDIGVSRAVCDRRSFLKSLHTKALTSTSLTRSSDRPLKRQLNTKHSLDSSAMTYAHHFDQPWSDCKRTSASFVGWDGMEVCCRSSFNFSER